MRFSSLLGLLGSGALLSAFPTANNIAHLARAGGLDIPDDLSYKNVIQEVKRQQEKRLLDNPLDTPVDVSGKHEWQAPDFAKGAQRGPCPGLNALANHGYISRDGVAGLLSIIGPINEVFGMDVGLATILSVMGTVHSGDPLSLTPGFSIDGYSPKVRNILGNLLGLLGEPRGIGKAHNWLEADASLTRDDLYVTGDASTMNMDKFMALYNRAGDNGIISEDSFLEHSLDGLQECKSTNPYCWYGPYTGMIARNAGIAFAVRLMSNHSAEQPEGFMSQEVLKSFWAVVDDENGDLQYKKGHERIPANWFKTPVDYGLVQLNMDLVKWISKYPELASIGGNIGTVDSFTLLDLNDLSGGLMNVPKLLEGNNLLCFVLQVVGSVAPDSLSGLFSIISKPLQLLSDTLGADLLSMKCAPAQELSYNSQPVCQSLKDSYPGLERAGACL